MWRLPWRGLKNSCAVCGSHVSQTCSEQTGRCTPHWHTVRLLQVLLDFAVRKLDLLRRMLLWQSATVEGMQPGACARAHVPACVHRLVFIHMCVYARVLHVPMCVCAYVCECTCVCVCVHVRVWNSGCVEQVGAWRKEAKN